MDPPQSTSLQKGRVRDHFDTDARIWQDLYRATDLQSRILQERMRLVMEFVDGLGLPRGARVLDIGCGAGLTSRRLLEHGLHVVAMDISPKMIELARSNCADVAPPGQVEFRVGDVEDLALEEGAFELVVAMGLIQYLEWDRWALQQMHRSLRIGGHLIVTAPNRLRLANLDPWFLAVQAKRRIMKRLARRSAGSRARGPAYFDRFYAMGRLQDMLTALGFDVKALHTHGYGPFWTIQRFQRLSSAVDRLFGAARRSGLAPFLAGMGSDAVVLAQAQPSLFGLDPRRPFPDRERHRQDFESDHRAMVGARDEWLRVHPRHRGFRAEALGPASYAGTTVLVIAPHPDDEIIGCGGTLLQLVSAGARVTALHATDGAASAGVSTLPDDVRHTIRMEHARAVAKMAGFHETLLWGRAERTGLTDEACVGDLGDVLGRLKPRLVFVPFLADPHPDHRAVNRILAQALERVPESVPGARVLGYQVWSLAPCNLYCEISGDMLRKERLLFAYRTEMAVDDYVHYCAALHAYDAARLTGRNGFVEGFFGVGAAEYLALSREPAAARA
ncbi:MAG: methyltransferase domain-containing protein [Candidatus Eisenbacteria bacterium]|uniref:Methyltransferase domain-containing protein n=1 Tax=Eiseniibacteriota bacterium TaxID=2212470 RepID=A0A538T0F7_UNCEI|nr:MAG: methyltransferase domain-containing protein [Candidatus Eisenbacteria bacterium]